jgi:hypothetical protein
MVVDHVNIAGGVRLFVVAENQPAVSGDSQAPKSFRLRLSGCGFQPGNRLRCSSAGDRRESGQEIFQRVTALKIIEQSLDGYACSAKDGNVQLPLFAGLDADKR